MINSKLLLRGNEGDGEVGVFSGGNSRSGCGSLVGSVGTFGVTLGEKSLGMTDLGLSVEQIAQALDLDLEQVRQATQG